MNPRFKISTLLFALTVLAVGIGIGTIFPRLIGNIRPGIKVVYDYGKFNSDVPVRFATALEQGTDFELLSLHPMQYRAPPDDNFHGWQVLGRTAITDNKVRDRLVAALRGGVNAESEAADCFEPRHGISVKSGGETIDFVICFACGWIEPWVGSERKSGFTVEVTPQPELDSVLQSAGVKLAPATLD